jgi:CHAT domain-containing protein
VQALRALYGASRSTVLTNAAASEAALRARASRATVLHLATHGVLDNKSPMYSHLLLAPGTGASANDDGKLEAWELMEMGLTANVAVLSACDTAGAGPGFGEGLMGLSWSLFASGASTAVVSQWAVDSASTTALMLVFHRQLLAAKLSDGASARALRQASLSLLKQPAYRHPFYWAGFVSIGAK